MSQPNQWEYQVLTVGSFFKGVKDDDLQSLLNQLGEDGWEVLAFRTIENTNQAQVIAKRPLDRTERRWRSMP
jgi:hypothetical protein